MFCTLIPSSGRREHIIVDKVTFGEGSTEYYKTGCGHDHFEVSEHPDEKLNFYEGSTGDVEPEDLPFCKRCENAVTTGMLFKMEQ